MQYVRHLLEDKTGFSLNSMISFNVLVCITLKVKAPSSDRRIYFCRQKKSAISPGTSTPQVFIGVACDPTCGTSGRGCTRTFPGPTEIGVLARNDLPQVELPQSTGKVGVQGHGVRSMLLMCLVPWPANREPAWPLDTSWCTNFSACRALRAKSSLVTCATVALPCLLQQQWQILL